MEEAGSAHKKRKLNPDVKDASKKFKNMKLDEIKSVNKLMNLATLNKLTPRIILWLRNDLRLHDNDVMNWAIQ